MKQQEIIICLQNFLVDHAESNQIHTNDLKIWLEKWNGGFLPDRNELYSSLNTIKGFLKCERKNIYTVDQKKALEFFKQFPDKEKEFKSKRGRV